MKSLASLFTMFLFVGMTGCGPTTEPATDSSPLDSQTENHDHHHDEMVHPQSFDEAVRHINETGKKITQSFADGEPENAHNDLHTIGQVIGSLAMLATDAGLSDGDLDAVRQATEKLNDAFGKLDSALHGGDAVEADEIAKEVSAQVEKLQSLL